MLEAEAPIRTPHAVVPHGQILGDVQGHSVVSPGQIADDLDPPDESRLRKMFDESRDLTNRSREEQQLDQDYYDGPAQLKKYRDTLIARGQPLIFDNRIAPGIDGILGVVENAKVDPRAFPRNPDGQQATEVCTKTLRYLADRAKWQQTKLDCAESYLKQGLTAAIVEVSQRGDDIDIEAKEIRWETFFYDPRSRRNDFKDAKYLGVAKWMYVDEVMANPDWAERAAKLGDLTVAHDNAVDNTWADRPTDAIRWVDKKMNRVLVVEIYYQHKSQWLRCVYCAAGYLEYGRSPYLNPRTGETRCPIIAMSFKVDRENNRYGPIRNMRPLQDEINARRSRGLHLINSRQITQSDPMAPPVDAALARAEMSRADGIIPAGWTPVANNDMAAGNLQLLTEAKDSLSNMVPVANAQDLREGTAASGRARQVAQQAGLTQFGRGFGRLEDFEESIYREFWMCAQQFWTAQMYVRVTDNPRAPEFLEINVPIMGPGIVQQPIMGPDGQPVMGEDGQPVTQSAIAQVQVGTERQIAQMDMDIIIGITPDTVALEQEIFDSIMDLVKSGVDPFSPTFELLIELAPLPDKTRLMERLKVLREQGQQGQAEQQQKQEQMADAAFAADMQDKAAKTFKTYADAHKSGIDADNTEVDMFLKVGVPPLTALLNDQPLTGIGIPANAQPSVAALSGVSGP